MNCNNLRAPGEYRRPNGELAVVTPELVAAQQARLAELLASLKPDVVVLQEVGSQAGLEAVVALTGVPYHFFLAQPDDRSMANAILYLGQGKVRSLGFSALPLPVLTESDTDTYGPRLATKRGYVQAELEFRGRPLHVIGLHLRSSLPRKLKNSLGKGVPIATQQEAGDGVIRSELWRLAEARAVRSVVDRLLAQDAEAQVVVLGDFNAQAGSTVCKVIEGPLAEGRLTRALDTVPADERYSVLRANGRRDLIDHVLISPSLVSCLGEVRILNSMLKSEAELPTGVPAIESDHASVVVELKDS